MRHERVGRSRGDDARKARFMARAGAVPGGVGEGIVVVGGAKVFGHARPDGFREAREENGLLVVGRKALEEREESVMALALAEDGFGQTDAHVAVDVEADVVGHDGLGTWFWTKSLPGR